MTLDRKTQGEDDMTVDTVQPQVASVISRTGAMAGSNNALRSGAARQVGRAAERKKQKPSRKRVRSFGPGCLRRFAIRDQFRPLCALRALHA